MFTDEASVPLVPTNVRTYSVQKQELPLEHRPKRKSATFGGGYVHLFGAITVNGFAYHTTYQTPMNAKKYVAILKEGVFKNPKKRALKGRWLFVQDNYSVHTAKATTTMLKSQCKRFQCEILEWPPKSPDLNLIENVWAEISRRLAKYEELPRNLDELEERIDDIIAQLNSPAERGYWTKLYDSFPDRLRAVVKGRGRPTRY